MYLLIAASYIPGKVMAGTINVEGNIFMFSKEKCKGVKKMMAKCYLCGRETDEFMIVETNPEIAVCFDCEEKVITKEVRKQLKNYFNRSKYITDLILEAKELYKLHQIFEGGDTYGKQR